MSDFVWDLLMAMNTVMIFSGAYHVLYRSLGFQLRDPVMLLFPPPPAFIERRLHAWATRREAVRILGLRRKQIADKRAGYR